jgi:hypothetical protein
MSHIPTSAMPHAGPTENSQNNNQTTGQQQQQGIGSAISEQAGKVADYARENPKTVAAAGVAIVGAIAAAAIPLVRGRSDSDSTSSKKSGSTSKSKNNNNNGNKKDA